MGQSNPETILHSYNSNECISYNESKNKFMLDNCEAASKFVFDSNDKIKLVSANKKDQCIDIKNNQIVLNDCKNTKTQWKYDPAIGYVKELSLDKCINVDATKNIILGDNLDCMLLNNTDKIYKFNENDRNGRCGKEFILNSKSNYQNDDGKCDPGRTCSIYGYCGEDQGFKSPTNKLFGNSNYDGAYIYSEKDRLNKCGPLYKINQDDSGKCDSGRYCSQFGHCQQHKQTNGLTEYDGKPFKTYSKEIQQYDPPSSYDTEYIHKSQLPYK
jgi:hypothetical protein